MNTQSLDPIDLYKALEKLSTEGKLKNFSGLWCLHDSDDQNDSIIDSSDAKANFFNEHIGFFALFEKPHPLDFEWRNSVGSLDYLINQIESTNLINDKILLLGFPTLFAAACIKDIPQHVTLVDKNEPVISDLEKLISSKDNFKIIQADIFNIDPKSLGKYQTVILDPPWYSPHFYQFMWLATQCVEIGGSIGISMPPINARPNISQERVEWFSFSQKNGLCLESLYAQKLSYAMPFFEFNAFRAAGIKDILPFWRRGDYAVFRKVEDTKEERPLLQEAKTEWIEVKVGTTRIRIKEENISSTNENLQIDRIINGDILPTVSARDPRRNTANIWTSGNRIFKVNDTSKFRELLNDHKTNNPKKTVDNDIIEFIETTIKFEKEEYNNYLDWLYHEMERQVD